MIDSYIHLSKVCYQLGVLQTKERKLTLSSERKTNNAVHLAPVGTGTRASSGLYLRGWQVLSAEGQIVNLFSCVNHTVSVTANQLCVAAQKQA